MLLLWHQGIRWRTSLWTVNSTAASFDAAFATAFLLLAGRHGSFQLWWRKTVYFPCPFICHFCRIATLLFFCMPPTHAYHRGNGGHGATSMFI